MAITTDNGSNVIRMARLLEIHTSVYSDKWALFDAKKQHISCIAHVINLAVQALLGKGGLGASKPEEVEDQEDDEDDSSSGSGSGEEIDFGDEEVLVPFNFEDELDIDSEDDGLET
ncbi:hypothetical protein BGZ76_008471, partial [Entomortierella beljakovae]